MILVIRFVDVSVFLFEERILWFGEGAGNSEGIRWFFINTGTIHMQQESHYGFWHSWFQMTD